MTWDDRARGLTTVPDERTGLELGPLVDGALVSLVVVAGASVPWLIGWSDVHAWRASGAVTALAIPCALVGLVRQRRRVRAYRAAVARREAALRAVTGLLDGGAITRPARDRLALEGWRGGLRVELSLRAAEVGPSFDDDELGADPADDSLRLRVGADPAPRRPRVAARPLRPGERVLTLPWLGPRARERLAAAWAPPLFEWFAKRPEPGERVADLVDRFQVRRATWGPDGVELLSPPSDPLLTRDRLEALLDGAQALARACGLRPAPDVRVTGAGAAWWCPYCHGELEAGPAERCRACATEHHAACLAEHGGCAVHGCVRSRVRAPAPEAKA